MLLTFSVWVHDVDRLCFTHQRSLIMKLSRAILQCLKWSERRDEDRPRLSSSKWISHPQLMLAQWLKIWSEERVTQLFILLILPLVVPTIVILFPVVCNVAVCSVRSTCAAVRFGQLSLGIRLCHGSAMWLLSAQSCPGNLFSMLPWPFTWQLYSVCIHLLDIFGLAIVLQLTSDLLMGALEAHHFIFWLQFPVHFPHLVYFLALSRTLLHFVCSRKYFYSHPYSSLVYCSELSPQGNFWYCISASCLFPLSTFHLTLSMQSSPFELS